MSVSQPSLDYSEPLEQASAEIEVQRSRFIGTVRKVLSPADVKQIVREERERHPGACHVVSAFIIGSPSSETAGLSDDGEPKGTAGRPVLEVLKGSGLRNALVTVTRYFGGTLLGTGGLARAYSDCCRQALEKTPRIVVRSEKEYTIKIPYDCFERVKHILSAPGCRITDEAFAEEISIIVFIADDIQEEICAAVRNASKGKGVISG